MTGPHERWLEKAEDDLRFAEIGLREGFTSQVCFLSQQAVEKSLKAFIIHKGEAYPKTHKLTDLGGICARMEPGFSAFSKEFRILDEFYIPTRYPDAMPGSLKDSAPPKKMAEETLATAQEIFQYEEGHQPQQILTDTSADSKNPLTRDMFGAIFNAVYPL